MIILASKSKARRDILKSLNVRFKVMPPKVREHRNAFGSPTAIVKANALLKARDVASRIRDGIVVACDTLVEQEKRIFGKPKTLKEAKAMLRRLSSKPHRLCTGIAVIDVGHRRELLDVEETKITMERLSDREIERYFKKVSPLDKAGGFDIRGLGGLFIKRIEGCYFNIVGLPVAKLSALLKKLGICLLCCLFCLALYGCATEFNVGTNQEDRMMYSSDREEALGDELSKQMERDFILVHDPELNKRLAAVGEKIAAVCDRRELLYRFRLVEDKEDKETVNAVSLPGGYVYVFKNLMKVAETDDELAAVLAHEVGHIVARHSVKRLQAIWGYNLLTLLAMAAKDASFGRGVQLAYAGLLTGYSQEDELLADKLGARYAKRAGYNPEAMLTFLKKLQARHRKEKPRPLSYFRTHPFTAERIRAVKEELGESLSFEDFINTL